MVDSQEPHARIIQKVESVFEVRQIIKTEFTLEFRIMDSDSTSVDFEELARTLESTEYMAKMIRTQGSLSIIVQKFQRKKPHKILDATWTPRILFGIVVTFVMIDGFWRTNSTNAIIEIGDPLEMSIIYTIALLGILGVHEAGHIVASRMHSLKTTWPYFIPGLPVIGIPTFGAFIQSRGLTINRSILFDVAVAGPVAGLVIAVIVSVYGAYTAPVIGDEVAQGLFAVESLSKWDQGEPLLMTASLAMFGKGGQGHEVIMTPVLFAAWVGFLITFLNLLPAWQLDGGHMARTLMSLKVHKYATFGSMAVLVALGYWIMAVLILFMSMRNPSASPLDEVTPLSKSRKMAYVGIIGLAIVCAPIPSSIPFLS